MNFGQTLAGMFEGFGTIVLTCVLYTIGTVSSVIQGGVATPNFLSLFVVLVICALNPDQKNRILTTIGTSSHILIFLSTILILLKNNDRGLFFSSEGYPVFFNSLGLPGRNFGIFSHPNVLGQCATISFLFILFSKTNKFALVFPIFCLVKCGSRSAIIGIIVAVIVYVLAKAFERKTVFRIKPREYTYVLGTFIVAILLSSVFQFINLVRYLDPGSLTGRVSIWQSSLEIVKESTLFGLGWGWSSRAIQSQLLNVWASSAHNAVLEFAFSTGVVGLFIFMLLISKVFAYFGNLTPLEKSLFVSLFATGFTESYIDLQYPTIQTYLLFAIIVTSHLREGHTSE